MLLASIYGLKQFGQLKKLSYKQQLQLQNRNVEFITSNISKVEVYLEAEI
jgi:hypothetical protein